MAPVVILDQDSCPESSVMALPGTVQALRQMFACGVCDSQPVFSCVAYLQAGTSLCMPPHSSMQTELGLQ